MALYQSMFPRDIFAELDRLQRGMQQAFDTSPSIRGLVRGGFPALNVGGTPDTVEIYAFMPGVDPATVEIVVDRGILTIAGERASSLPPEDSRAALHMAERFAGRFRRMLTLSDDIDPNGISAAYRDGVLHITAKRHESAQPRRIAIQ